MKRPGALLALGSVFVLAGLGGLAMALRRRSQAVSTPLPTLLLGDSMGVGLATPLRRLGAPLHSIAVEGTTIAYWASGKGHDELVKALAGLSVPGSVFVALGTNDAFEGDSYAAKAGADAKALIEVLSKTVGSIYWIAPPTLPATYGGRAPSSAVIEAIKQAVQSVPNASWISTDATIERAADKLHPTAAGYQHWADLIFDALGRSSDTSNVEPERPAPPGSTAPPQGWKYKAKATQEETAFATKTLLEEWPIGHLSVETIGGREVGAFTTWHWDNHVGGTWKWHPGVSILERT